MPKLPLPAEVADLLSRPNPAVITAVRPDGQPISVATWYIMDGDRVLVNMDVGRRRLQHLRNDPRVSITVLDGDDWSTHVSIQGRVVEMRDDYGFAGIDRLARQYTGKPFHDRDRARVNAWIEIERWNAWGLAPRHAIE